VLKGVRVDVHVIDVDLEVVVENFSLYVSIMQMTVCELKSRLARRLRCNPDMICCTKLDKSGCYRRLDDSDCTLHNVGFSDLVNVVSWLF
jgi:hypothetical protein